MLILVKLYDRFVRRTFVHQLLARLFDAVVNAYCVIKKFSFPPQYIRRWKLDMLEEKYERDTVTLFKQIIKPGIIIVDIGAHIGYFTRMFSRLTGLNGKVYAFEADPENFSLLKKNTAHLENVKLFPVAVSDQVGSINFFHSNDKTGCHSTIGADFRQEKFTVPAVDLDSFLAKEGVAKIDLIKMDIEGGETKALAGMKKILSENSDIKLLTEFNPECLDLAQIPPLDFLKEILSLGFTIFAVTSTGLVKMKIDDTTDYHEYLFGGAFVNIFCSRDK